MPSSEPTLKRLKKLASTLAATYPDAKCELNFESPIQLLVAVILSAQCTDKRVNLVTPTLFRRCPDARTLAEIPQKDLEEMIHSTGFYRNKAKMIRACCRAVTERFRGRVPDTMKELITLDGVGRKTANVILNVVWGKDEGVCVDTHVLRLAGRLGLSRETTPEGVERDLMRLFSKEQWGDVSHWLIWHGRRRCFARGPDCPGCEVRRLCPSAKIFMEKSKKPLRGAPKSGRSPPRDFPERRQLSHGRSSTNPQRRRNRIMARKPNAAFMKPVQPDAALAAVVGSKAIPRTELTKKLWAYIRKNGLQDKKNKRNINADDALKAVFGGKKVVSMFEMTKLVNKHVK
ncbi:MAG: endonuclease III [Verrucomicrobiae bacterium]|nr:endonuclease III [Verrucomicrobiae bacterium]